MSQADADCQRLKTLVVNAFLERHPHIRRAIKRDFLMSGYMHEETERAIADALDKDAAVRRI